MTNKFICLVDDLTGVKATPHVHDAQVMAGRRVLTPELKAHGVGGHWRNLEPTTIAIGCKQVPRAGSVSSSDVLCRERVLLRRKLAGD